MQRLVFPSDHDDPSNSLYLRARGQVTTSRTEVELAHGSSVSLATYFGAFPAGAWMRWVGARAVRVQGQITGDVKVTVFVRSADGEVRTVIPIVDSGELDARIVLEDGDSWAWLEVDAAPGAGTLSNVSWQLDEATMPATVVCITTYNRPGDCVSVLDEIARDPEVLSFIERVVVVDQGDDRVRDAEGFTAAQTALRDRLQVVEQANLGGSGGFSRGMLEALAVGADAVMLLDDDVRLEPESLRRLAAFAARTATPTIVGAHMLDMHHPTRLHTWAERVEPTRFEWRSVHPETDRLDLANITVTELPTSVSVDFNGWWMCLIPASVVAQFGAAMPYFIKWDDTEFSLRAWAGGVPTVSLPGSALWHVAWTGKDDGLDWQAYFQLRNRVVTALLHSDRSPRGLLAATFAQDVNHLMCMQYGSAAARRQALRDILRGPAHLDQTLARRPRDMRELMRRAGQTLVPDEELPVAAGDSAPEAPQGTREVILRLARVAGNQLRRTRRTADVDVALTRREGKWWALGVLDSATVSSATGSGAFVARRDRARAARLLIHAIGLRLRLWLRWRSIAAEYRAAAPELRSIRAWQARFDGHSADG